MGLDTTSGSLAPSALSGSAEKSSNFFLGFLFLEKEKRRALSAVYGYCRLIDDIVDSGHLGKEQARAMLEFWRAEIDRLYAGTPTHSLSRALLEPVRRFELPQEAFLEMIRGCAMDLEATRYETIEQLESYMQGVACSVGRLSLKIFGTEYSSAADAAAFAQLFGYAFQLTNIIRDVGADLEMGRVYLPESEMKAAGYSRELLIRREHTPAFDRLMDGLYQRAKTCYRRGRNAVDFRDRPALLPAEIMAHVYEGLLEKIREDGFRVLFQKTELSRGRKLALAVRAWLYCHGLHY